MHFTGLTNTEFTLLFSSAAFLAVVFYLLSFRRRTAIVATEPIWRKVLGKRRTPYRKLLALLLQILVLFLLSLAMADPRTSQQDHFLPVAQVMIVDTSASMNALDGKNRRIDRALELFSKVTDAMGPRDRLLPVVMDDRCRPLTAWSGDKKSIREAAKNLTPSFVPEDFQSCVDFAQRALDSDAFGEGFRKRIAVISDHFHALEQKTSYPIVQTSVGRAMDNLAITAFEVRLRGGAASGYEVFVQLSNFGSTKRQLTLSIHTEKSLLGEEVLSLAAKATLSRSYFLKELAAPGIMASITSPKGRGGADGFPLDDRAYALLPSMQERKVLLVTDGNLYLEKALQLDPSLEVQVVKPSEFTQALTDDVQVVVFDGPCVDVDKPAIYFAPQAGGSCPFESSDEVEFPQLFPVSGDHPVTEGVTLVDVRVNKARHLVLLRGDKELMQDKNGPLLIVRENGEKKSIAFGFDITQSDLPLRIAFPILIHNCITWFMGEHKDLGGDAKIVASTIWLPDWARNNCFITDPKGRISHPVLLGSRSLFRPRFPGFYDISSKDHVLKLAINFNRPQESSLASMSASGSAGFTWQAGAPPGALILGFDTTQTRHTPKQWPTVLLVAAWLLLFDWLFFCFRILF